jgi:hypothetical protein
MIVFLSDFGQKDEYVGVVKGVISSINPQVRIVDLCHHIPAQNVSWAGLVLYKSYRYFPQNSIFLSVVDPGVGSERKIIILQAEDYYFLAPDNGLLTLIYRNLKLQKLVQVQIEKFSFKPFSSTFHGRDVFAPISAHLSLGKELTVFGTEIEEIKLIDYLWPEFGDQQVIAKVIHIDGFGNLITNLEREKFEKLGWREFEVAIKQKRISGIVSSYSQGGDLVAIWESRNLLEIAVPNGSAAQKLKAELGEEVRLIKRK